MKRKKPSNPVPGWVGGFAESNPAFAYPNPDLTSLPMLGNMANIDLLQRQQGVEWPEFSWESEKGKTDPKRCFQMFAPYISRLGYTATGRVYSIICPQQGIYHPKIGALNVEVTVTGQRGWVNETTKEVAADMTVEGQIWFSPAAQQNPIVQILWNSFKNSKLPFPSEKAKAIKVTTHKFQDPGNRSFQFGLVKPNCLRVPTLLFTRKPGGLQILTSRSARSERQIMTSSITSTSSSWMFSTWLLVTCSSLATCCPGTSGLRGLSS